MFICIKVLYTNRVLFDKRPRNAEGSVWIRNVRRDSTQLTSLLHVTWLTRILDTLPWQISVLSCLLFIRGLGMQRAAYEGAMCDMILHNRHASVMWHAPHIAIWSIATWRVCACVYVCMWVKWHDSHIATWFLATWYIATWLWTTDIPHSCDMTYLMFILNTLPSQISRLSFRSGSHFEVSIDIRTSCNTTQIQIDTTPSRDKAHSHPRHAALRDSGIFTSLWAPFWGVDQHTSRMPVTRTWRGSGVG